MLARLLTPGDYGLVAMVLSVIGVGELFRDLGLSAAAIRAETLTPGAARQPVLDQHRHGRVLSGAVIACAPLIARLFGQPELVPITHALSTTFLAQRDATQYRADLNRQFKFGRLAVSTWPRRFSRWRSVSSRPWPAWVGPW